MASHRRPARRLSTARGRTERHPPPLVWLGFAILLSAIFILSYRLSTGAPSAAGNSVPRGGEPTTTFARSASPATAPSSTDPAVPTTLAPLPVQPTTARAAGQPTTTTAPLAVDTTTPARVLSTASPSTTTPVTSPSGHPSAAAARAAPEREPALQHFAGTLSYPNDVASSYSFNPAHGVVVISGRWPAGSGVRVTVSCRHPRTVQVATASFSTRFSTPGGSCRLAIAEQPFVNTKIPYSLTLRYPILVTP